LAKAQQLATDIWEWSQANTERSHRAHVVFVARSLAQLQLMLPEVDSVPRVLTVPDLTLEEAREIITARLKDVDSYSEERIDSALELVGGRLQNLHSLLQLTDGTHSLAEAERALLQQAEHRVLSKGFGERLFTTASKGKWTQTQLWRVMQVLAEQGAISFDQARYGIFEGNEAGLMDLVAEDLLQFVPGYGTLTGAQTQNGATQEDVGCLECVDETSTGLLTASCPLQLAAMRSLIRKPELAVPMHNLRVNELLASRTTELNGVEEELQRLLANPNANEHGIKKFPGVQRRADSLDARVLVLTKAIEQLEASRQ
jgi:RNA12 protein